MALDTIHPFPARMAPDIVRDVLTEVEPGRVVLDPMCGSGTVLRVAAERGLSGIGVDIDPLAVLMAQAWTSNIETYRLVHDAKELVLSARALKAAQVASPPDDGTANFIRYWFDDPQREQLARLATALASWSGETRDALAIAISRTIVTKEMAASLARDTSHSRPHRVAERNDYDVYDGFRKAAALIGRRLNSAPVRAIADIRHGDARDLHWLSDGEVDVIVTSPPYLNAIDYLRGHRMALVWLGYDVATIKGLRARSIGAERSLAGRGAPNVSSFVAEDADRPLSDLHRGWVSRFALDMGDVLREMRRVISSHGRAWVVVGNSMLRGAEVDNAELLCAMARQEGFAVAETSTREIPARRRYLPPPGNAGSALDTRMRTEAVLTLIPV